MLEPTEVKSACRSAIVRGTRLGRAEIRLHVAYSLTDKGRVSPQHSVRCRVAFITTPERDTKTRPLHKAVDATPLRLARRRYASRSSSDTPIRCRMKVPSAPFMCA